VLLPPALGIWVRQGLYYATTNGQQMKLYKYVSTSAAKAILSTRSIGFSRPSYFNDPFDTPIAMPVPTSNPIDGLFAHLGARGKSSIWEENTAILSLTRTMTNMLMWAHYADSHQGVVLGIDMERAGFLDDKTNMVPAHLGSVIYSRHRNMDHYRSHFGEPVVVGATHHFVLSHYEKWQRLFLTKPLEWAYEEEVRVVKCIRGVSANAGSNSSGCFSIVNLRGRPIHCFHIPDDAITDIYIGLRADPAAVGELIALAPKAIFHQSVLDQEAYALTTRPHRNARAE